MIRFGLKLQHAKRTLGLCAALALGACGVTPDTPGGGGGGNPPPPSPGVSVQNLDGLPFPDRLVFSRIQSVDPATKYGMHDTVQLRISNTGSTALRISSFAVTGPWTVTPNPSSTSPLEIAPGGSTDVTVKFTAQTTPTLHVGMLKVMSGTDTKATVQLAGLWQPRSEESEPSLDDIRKAFGFQFNLVNPGESPEVLTAEAGQVKPHGDETISGYWQRADASRPVRVLQLAAFHNNGKTATLHWYAKGNPGGLNAVLTHEGLDGQTLLPRKHASSQLSVTEFTPGVSTFGFNVDGVEYSDPNLNRQSDACEFSRTSTKQCGLDLRFWTAKDRDGKVIPNTYFMTMDYVGINYDYNDSVYLVSNVKPAPVLIDVGTSNGATFTASDGRIWIADDTRTSYRDPNDNPRTKGNMVTLPKPSGSTAPNEPAQPTSVDILDTVDDPLYRSYRALITPIPANMSDRVMSYNVPIDNGTYNVVLHFAELYWNGAGQRVFDIYAEGALRQSNYDIFVAAGNRKNAKATLTLNGVNVSDGMLTIETRAVKDFGAVSAIEILR